jgi:hypothetical protein
MTDGDDMVTGVGDLAARRERVVQAVLERIAAAPHVGPGYRPPSIDLAVWSVPALAAAAVIMIVSGAALLATEPHEAAGGTAIEWLGLSRPVAEYLETGTLAPAAWLDAYGNRQ